jgi:hypothetical protein
MKWSKNDKFSNPAKLASKFRRSFSTWERISK